jgi:lipopolysaccharide transport system ATP-binding protein
VLIIDEALSVGDGEFARKSFDRILALKNQGTTILFCTHSLFHIEAMCSRAIWLDKGAILKDGHPSLVIPVYQDFLDGVEFSPSAALPGIQMPVTLAQIEGVMPLQNANDEPSGESVQAIELAVPQGDQPRSGTLQGYARLRTLTLGVKGANQEERVYGIGDLAHAQGQVDSLLVRAMFESDPEMPAPSFAVTLHSMDGRIIGSAGAWNDGVTLARSVSGGGWVELVFPSVALLKGTYSLSAFLFCERGLHIYDNADHFIKVQISQQGIEQGLFHVPRVWRSFDQAPLQGFKERTPHQS